MRLEVLNGEHAPPEALGVVMRGPSEWSPGERELFAAFASHLNQCVF
jgi:hypothetical protein